MKRGEEFGVVWGGGRRGGVEEGCVWGEMIVYDGGNGGSERIVI